MGKQNCLWRGFQSQKIQTSNIQRVVWKSKYERIRKYCRISSKSNQTAEYLLRVDQIVNAIKGLGGGIKEKEVVKKILRILPIRYNPKVSTIEYRDDIELLIVD